jgi:hypothetical protein
LRDSLYAGRVKLFTEQSKLFAEQSKLYTLAVSARRRPKNGVLGGATYREYKKMDVRVW